jgi:hypothetical protein
MPLPIKDPRDRSLVEALTQLKERKPWGEEAKDIDHIVDSYLQDITEVGQTDDPFLRPITGWEYLGLEGLTEYVPLLEAAGISQEVIACYVNEAMRIAVDPRDKLRGMISDEIDDRKEATRKFYSERERISKDYMKMLAEDVVELKKAGMPDGGLQVFMYRARIDFLAGSSDDEESMTEEQRLTNYRIAKQRRLNSLSEGKSG